MYIDTNALCHSIAAFEARVTSLSSLCSIDVMIASKLIVCFLRTGTVHCILATHVSPMIKCYACELWNIYWVNEYINAIAESLWTACLIQGINNTFFLRSSYWLLFGSGRARYGNTALWCIGVFWFSERWSVCHSFVYSSCFFSLIWDSYWTSVISSQWSSTSWSFS